MAARNEHVFLVRMWTDDHRGDTSAWRGSVRHVGSGRTLFVAAAAEVADFITLRLGDRAAPAKPGTAADDDL